MPIEDRAALARPGTVLEATHKETKYTARTADGRTLTVDGIDGEFSSPSGAGKAVTGGAVNGWAFWSVVQVGEGEPAQAEPKAETSEERHARQMRAYDPLKRMPGGRFFCDGCMRAVHLNGEGACPIGHTRQALRTMIMGTEPVAA